MSFLGHGEKVDVRIQNEPEDSFMSFQLPSLPYPYDALEPHIDARTMEIHHTKHHQAYTNNLNGALEGQSSLASKSAEDILRGIKSVPESVRQAVINNGGGFVNHNLFWTIMGPNKGAEPKGDLAEALKKTWGEFTKFKDEFAKAATTRFGSGWAWLVLDGEKKLQLYSQPNQDSPYMQGHIPILGLDVWEHAYYLKYQNRRPEYIAAWWNVVNWDKVGDVYAAARK